jgi:putative nucleotidyltransferase with HDIG domain
MNQELALANREIATANQAIRYLNDELFLILAKVIDARDPYVAGHVSKAADYAAAMAAELGLQAERVEHVRQAALLHDIGKLGISEQLLRKQSRLSDEEYAIVKTHAALGAEFLETCQSLQHLAPFVRYHHEWWDGRGYPDGLQGEQIPLEARILAVCDAVEAMASDRSYQRAVSLSKIMAELQSCAGTQFDPAVVLAFINLAKREGERLVTNSAQEVARLQAARQNERNTLGAWSVSQPAGKSTFSAA